MNRKVWISFAMRWALFIAFVMAVVGLGTVLQMVAEANIAAGITLIGVTGFLLTAAILWKSAKKSAASTS